MQRRTNQAIFSILAMLTIWVVIHTVKLNTIVPDYDNLVNKVNVLLERGDQTYNSSDMGIDYSREVEFRFLRDDLVDASLVIEPGDILLYYESYFEVDSIKDNQLFVGKDPRYPYNSNPLNPGLGDFGANISTLCECYYIPADKVAISPYKERF